MNDELEILLDSSDGSSYLESLIKSRYILYKNPNLDLVTKINNLIDLELDLAILGTEKAISELKKDAAKDNIRPIK